MGVKGARGGSAAVRPLVPATLARMPARPTRARARPALAAAEAAARRATAPRRAAPPARRRAGQAPPSPRMPPPAASNAAASASTSEAVASGAGGGAEPTLVCTSVTAATTDAALLEILVRAGGWVGVVCTRERQRGARKGLPTPTARPLSFSQEAKAAGATAVELRLDFLTDLDTADPRPVLATLLAGCARAGLPAVVTFRPAWEGGHYAGDEAPRLAVLKYAALLGAACVDVEVLASRAFFAAGGPPVPPGTRVILSHHDYAKTPAPEALAQLMDGMFEAGADVAKIAATAARDADAAILLNLAARGRAAGRPVIALAMGERGVATRVLAGKYGGWLTFGALDAGRASAPGQPTLADLVGMYRVPAQTASTAVLGVIGDPVAHSRSPALHNAALAAAAVDAVYLPLRVQGDLAPFLAAFDDPDWKGFSVTLPHKVAALAAAATADPAATLVGAANTLVRQADGSLKAYNTDATAAVEAIEEGLRRGQKEEGGSAPPSSSPLAGTTVVVLGAGGAGRALAFGAAAAGAAVVVAARRADAAEALAADVRAAGFDARGVSIDDVASGAVQGDVLANTTPVGMGTAADPSAVERSPVPAACLSSYRLVFDAVYTPRDTRLLRDAAGAGVATVDGVEMFVRQAAAQFALFTGVAPPLAVMRAAVVRSLGEEA